MFCNKQRGILHFSLTLFASIILVKLHYYLMSQVDTNLSKHIYIYIYNPVNAADEMHVRMRIAINISDFWIPYKYGAHMHMSGDFSKIMHLSDDFHKFILKK